MSQKAPAVSLWPALNVFMRAGLLSAILAVWPVADAVAQSASATLTGTVVDSTGAVLSGVTVTAVHQDTSTKREVQSAADGSFTIPTLVPGPYVVLASKSGFRPSELRDVILNVDDRRAVRLELAVAGMDESVTVSVEGGRINTSPGVSTVIDRTFVENLPLNGRSLQSLLELTPGVVPTRAALSGGGQFSVNGQRSTSNYITVDGVSANASAPTNSAAILSTGGSGQLPGLTSVGGTMGLVSVDALQEFRIQTSGFAPEFGRMVGGQVSLVTRAGTNAFHGSAFEYFRHDAMDAIDWFTNRSGLPQAEMHQHDFGGVLGGPILRNRTFAFGSYERLDLKIPRARSAAVPTLETRRNAAAAFRPYLDGLPLPNGAARGDGFADFQAVYSDPSKVDSRSVRIDHNVGGSLKFFGRFSDAPSYSETRGPSYGYTTISESNTRSGTIGSTWVMSRRAVHDVRANVTTAQTPISQYLASLGGSAESPVPLPSGRDPSLTGLTFFLPAGGQLQLGPAPFSDSKQFNVVDSLTLNVSSHEVKFGLDFRRSETVTKGGVGRDFIQTDPQGLVAGRLSVISMTFSDPRDREITFDNLSVYAQDHWKLASRLTLSYGLRWELVLPPETSGVEGLTLTRTDNLFAGQIGLAEAGTAFWKTTYNNVAPRIGASYVVSDNVQRPLLLKGGFGTFYDLGYGQSGNVSGWSYPYTFSRSLSNVTLPLDTSLVGSPVFGTEAPSTLTVTDKNLQLPYTLQWNISADQGLGRHQTLSVSYVGANGHRMLRTSINRLTLLNWPSSPLNVNLTTNGGSSDYHALQVQFNRRLSRGMQAIVSYTLGRSRDTESAEGVLTSPTERYAPADTYGYSAFDVRHLFNAALTYHLPQPSGPRVWRAVARDWGVDLMLRAHSAYPIEVTGNVVVPPSTYQFRPDVISGQSIWLDDPTAPGGRRLNRQAFRAPTTDKHGDLVRNSIRGFNLSQVDLAIRRELRLPGQVRLQLRFEAFNLLNTPNFADPTGRLENADFGLSTQMLGQALGGQNVLYQIGGPRSIQLATKVLF